MPTLKENASKVSNLINSNPSLVMALSDNVVRLGLTPKFKDTETLQKVKFIIFSFLDVRVQDV